MPKSETRLASARRPPVLANPTTAMMRPELMEIKTHIKSLKKEAEMRLTLDVEAQQSFEFLSDQVQGLRKAFSTLSDVLIEEVDLIRSEAATRHEEVAEKLSAQAKGLKAARTDLTLLRSEAQAARATHQTKAAALEERLEALHDDLATLAQEVAKGGSSQHLLQLEVSEMRAAQEEEARERRAADDGAAARAAELRERIDAIERNARASLEALDADVGALRATAEQGLANNEAAAAENRGKLLQCAQAIEKQWAASKVWQQRVESVSSSGALHNQQLSERLETLNKQQARWRTGLEDAVKAVAADVQLAQAQARALEGAVGSTKADCRRLIAEQEGETQRQCDTLGRAIHSLADTLNLTSPLITIGSAPPPAFDGGMYEYSPGGYDGSSR